MQPSLCPEVDQVRGFFSYTNVVFLFLIQLLLMTRCVAVLFFPECFCGYLFLLHYTLNQQCPGYHVNSSFGNFCKLFVSVLLHRCSYRFVRFSYVHSYCSCIWGFILQRWYLTKRINDYLWPRKYEKICDVPLRKSCITCINSLSIDSI